MAAMEPAADQGPRWAACKESIPTKEFVAAVNNMVPWPEGLRPLEVHRVSLGPGMHMMLPAPEPDQDEKTLKVLWYLLMAMNMLLSNVVHRDAVAAKLSDPDMVTKDKITKRFSQLVNLMLTKLGSGIWLTLEYNLGTNPLDFIAWFSHPKMMMKKAIFRDGQNWLDGEPAFYNTYQGMGFEGHIDGTVSADERDAWIETHRHTVDGGGVSVKTNWNLGFDQEPEEIPY